MIKASDNQKNFVVAMITHAEEQYQKDWLNKVDELLNWTPIVIRLSRLYSPNEGRPAIDPLVMFKSLLLAEWHGLSDRDLKKSLEYRYDFRRFTDLPFEDEAPDDTTFVVFRKRIASQW